MLLTPDRFRANQFDDLWVVFWLTCSVFISFLVCFTEMKYDDDDGGDDDEIITHVLADQTLFLPLNQQRQSTEGTFIKLQNNYITILGFSVLWRYAL